MNRTVFMHSCVLLFGVFISAVSQVILKKSANKRYDSVIREYLNFPVIFAYIIFIISTFLSIVAYKGIPLSMGPVLEATSYIYVTFFGIKIFKEKMNWKKFISLLLIMVGIVIYSLWG